MFRKGLIIVTTSLALVTAAGAQQTAAPRHGEQPQGQTAAAVDEECQRMMTMRHEMMQKRKEAEARLEALLHRLDTAEGQAKLDALVAVVKELASQQKALGNERQEERPRMMVHMMRHMHAAMMQGSDPAQACPMMRSMMSGS